ncbi:cyclic lactone autoinducer peptide [Paenibacillus sp. GD4]|nr:cyclic lactone autoinducer peptide [Paenibacillus sp. GD4]MDQ1909865.1 cyclic lactone autoinducer peptide [Paenibacillus sp. GD4]
MKHQFAKYASIVLAALGSLFVFSNSFIMHRPETPAELLKK